MYPIFVYISISHKSVSNIFLYNSMINIYYICVYVFFDNKYLLFISDKIFVFFFYKGHALGLNKERIRRQV